MRKNSPPAAAISANLLERRIAAACERVDEELERLIRSEEAIPGLHEGMLYALGLDLEDRVARGKRLRPALCLLTAQALGGEERRAMPFALAIELMHNFALVHDDIEDGDRMRRGRPCAYQRFGLAHGVNIGDYLFCKTLSALLDAPRYGLAPAMTLRLLRLMSQTLDHTHIGQALDISARGRRDLTLDDYYRLVREKTGYYLAAPLLGGAITAGAPRAVLGALERLGHTLGPLFQIQDDLIDLTSAKGRDARGSDIREGKRSYCVVWTAPKLQGRERERFWRILDKPREKTTEADIAWMVAVFEHAGALEAAREEIRRLQEQSLIPLTSLPGELQSTLRAFVEHLAQRTK